MRYAVYTREGLDYDTPYGVYTERAKADEVAKWLADLGNIVIIFIGR